MCGGSPQQAPQGYQPAQQGKADQSYMAGMDQLAGWGSDLYNSVAPQFGQVTSNVTNNPYFAQAMTGAQTAANNAQTVAQGQFGGASQLQNLGAQAAGWAPNLLENTTAYGAGLAQPASAYATGAAPMAAGYGMQHAPEAAAYGQQGSRELNSLVPITTQPELMAGLATLMQGYDPQSTLYNREYQKQQDQQNAIDSMSGVAMSPYGAGIAGQASQNFNTDWQNSQLQRQIAALGAYDQASSTAAGNASNLIGTGSNVLNSGLTTGSNILNSGLTTGSNILNSGLTTASNIYNSGVTTGTNAYTALGGLANESAKTASDLGIAGLNTQATAAQLPYDLYLQQQQAQLAALGAQTQGTNAAASLTQGATADAGTYLNIGQGATANAQVATSINNKAAADQAAGFGNLFGDVTGMFLFH